MKILWQAHWYYPHLVGGLEVTSYNLVREWGLLGHDVTVLAENRGSPRSVQEIIDRAQVIRYGAARGRERLWVLHPLRRLLHTWTALRDVAPQLLREVDVCFCVLPELTVCTRQLRPPCPVVYRPGTLLGIGLDYASAPDASVKLRAAQALRYWQDRSVAKRALGAADGIIVASRNLAEQLDHYYHVPAEKVHIVPNGIEHARYAHAAIAPEMRSALGQDVNRMPTVIYTGRLSYEKNLAFLLRAFARTACTGAVLVLVGDGPDRASLEALARSLGIEGRIRFLGYRADVERYLAGSDIFVLPSIDEAFGNSLLEAMAAGLPCLALRPDFPHVRVASAEIIRDGETGYLVDPHDPTDLARRLDELMADPNRRAALGKRGSEVARDRYSWRDVALRYLELSRAISPRRPRRATPG